MKRSEMIQRLYDIINSKLYQDYQFSEEELAEILTEIEVAGMMPPEIREFVEIPPHSVLGAGFKVGHSVNKWEPEDETK